MYNISMLRHWFSNERWEGGRPESPSSLILKKVCNLWSMKRSYFWFPRLSGVTIATSLQGVLEIF